MNGFVFHPDAVADLKEIRELIAADNPGATNRVLKKSMKRFVHSSLSHKKDIAVPI